MKKFCIPVILAVLVAITALTAGPSAAAAPGSGYVMIGAAGNVYSFGSAPYCGGTTVTSFLGEAATDIELTPDGRGYWTLETYAVWYGDGGFSSSFYVSLHYCDGTTPLEYERSAFEYGSDTAGVLRRGEYATSMSITPDGSGFWVFTNHGRVFNYGSAQWYGDMGNVALNGPVYDSVATPTGKGYYMVASDGGIFAFGDAQFYGSMGGQPLNQPVISMAPDPDGVGYWLVALDGGIFAFEAPFLGSMGSIPLNKPVRGIVASPTGGGYLMVAEDGGIFTFGDVPFHGSLGANPPASPITAVSVIR